MPSSSSSSSIHKPSESQSRSQSSRHSNSPSLANSHQISAATSTASNNNLTPTLPILISYLLASKRSLSSINLVQRATSILSEARFSIQSTTALLAQSIYLRQTLRSQVRILQALQVELEATAGHTHDEVRGLVRDLDEVDGRLEQAIGRLRGTRHEDVFTPRLPPVASGRIRRDDNGADKRNLDHDSTQASVGEEVPKETLHDFIDDQPVIDIRDGIKASLDDVERAKMDMEACSEALGREVETIEESIANTIPPKKGADHDTATNIDNSNLLTASGLRHLLQDLESHAHEMAGSLEDLVKHFDLCVTAIKHTEGYSGYIDNNTITSPDDNEAKHVLQDVADPHEIQDGLNLDLPPGLSSHQPEPQDKSPLSASEYSSLLTILATDNQDLDSIVTDLSDRNASMESTLDRILSWQAHTQRQSHNLSSAFDILESLGTRLPGYLREATRYATCWAEERVRIEDSMLGLQELTQVYERFSHAYDGLIVEAARRQNVEAQMGRIVEQARRQLGELYGQDMAERQGFLDKWRESLPSDVWSGLGEGPIRWDVVRLGGGAAGIGGGFQGGWGW